MFSTLFLACLCSVFDFKTLLHITLNGNHNFLLQYTADLVLLMYLPKQKTYQSPPFFKHAGFQNRSASSRLGHDKIEVFCVAQLNKIKLALARYFCRLQQLIRFDVSIFSDKKR